MEYERIHKLQTGLLSPSKLRMKSHPNLRKKDSCATTSPSKHHESDLVNNSLLNSAADSCCFHGDVEQAASSSATEGDQYSKESVCRKQPRRADSAGTVQTSAAEDENIECDSNASSSSFEFPRSRPRQLARSFSRPPSSKWNDAEKWIISRQQTASKKNINSVSVMRQNQMMMRVSSAAEDPKLLGGLNRIMLENNKAVEPVLSQVGLDEVCFTTPADVDFQSQDKSAATVPVVRAVSMRDMGTEMTPMASQVPSTTSTPIGATTALCSPNREPEAATATDNNNNKIVMVSEEEAVKLKTRREIIALGVQLGKKNFAAWASEQEKAHQINMVVGVSEFERRAAAWEQVEKTKHEARYKREAVMIKLWESRQKAKLEAEMRRIEAKVEEMRCEYQAKMLQKIATSRHRSEEKRAKAESRKNKHARTSEAMAGYIRRKGFIPYPYICCGCP